MNLTFYFLLAIITFSILFFIDILNKKRQLFNNPNRIIAHNLLKNSKHKESKELLQDYLYVFRSKKFYKDFVKYKHLIYLNYALSYLVSCEFNFTNWSLVHNENYTRFTFINTTKDKAFELLIDVNNVKVIPYYFDNGSFEAKSIEEAIEKTNHELLRRENGYFV